MTGNGLSLHTGFEKFKKYHHRVTTSVHGENKVEVFSMLFPLKA